MEPGQVQRTMELLDQGATVPFIARYRKEATGGLDDTTLRRFAERLDYLRGLEARKEEVRRLLTELEVLTPELQKALDAASTLQEVEDLYRPYRPKRKTRASVARERGLEPLARALLAQAPGSPRPEVLAKPFVTTSSEMAEDRRVATVEEALAGARDILAEEMADSAAHRASLRDLFSRQGSLTARATKKDDPTYKNYYEYAEPLVKAAGHRILAVNRGEREGLLRVSVEVPDDRLIQLLQERVRSPRPAPTTPQVLEAAADAYARLIKDSLEREARKELTERAEAGALEVFGANLRNLLLQRPLRDLVVLGMDPGYRTGCKLAATDPTGRVLETGVIYLTQGEGRLREAEAAFRGLVDRHRVGVVAIGNGTASRETEAFVARMLRELPEGAVKPAYVIVNEAGASVYSASKTAAAEFPGLDVTLRSAVSLARRLQDPLAELVKIDPKALGIGQYQHDLNQKRLAAVLGGVVEACVNTVGVDLNTASAALLSYVAGLSASAARNIVAAREKAGAFSSREELKKVKGMGDKTFEQCAGFLRVPGGRHPLDATSVHPESYPVTLALLEETGHTLEEVPRQGLRELRRRLEDRGGVRKIAERLGVGVPTLEDIVEALIRPGRDPREDLPPPLLRDDVLSIKDLSPGMTLQGTVRNVTDFGAFVDIGVHQDGLVHLSELSDTYVRHPAEVVALGEVVTVRIVSVDVERKRIGLSMKSALTTTQALNGAQRPGVP